MSIITSREHHEGRPWAVLRTLNHDRWAPAFGYGMHFHANMEIISYVLNGALTHEDSLGNLSTIHAHEVQVMSSGQGVTHSEFNASKTEPVEFAQIWIEPMFLGMPPDYAKKSFSPQSMRGRLCLLVSRDRREATLKVWQDVSLYAGMLTGAENIRQMIEPGRRAYIYVLRGHLMLNDVPLGEGEWARVIDENEIVLSGGESAHFLYFEVA